MADEDQGETIHMESGVSVFDGSPFVVLRWGKESGQLEPLEAEQHALALIMTSMAARIDAAVYAELTETLELPKEAAVAFIASLRKRTGRME